MKSDLPSWFPPSPPLPIFTWKGNHLLNLFSFQPLELGKGSEKQQESFVIEILSDCSIY